MGGARVGGMRGADAVSVYVRPPPTSLPGPGESWREPREPHALPRARVVSQRPPGVSLVHQLVREGRVTPDQGAMLLEFRRQIAWSRLPWWQRAGLVLWRAVFTW